ncbi:MAG TPA: hypothetical protein VFZ17_05310 [Acidimicrobiia bacterium]|nr:hypothetical protein [Acidimicrobiia bacterium]
MADDKAAHDRALEMFVYAPVGVALYVRDMLPTMMGIFVSRGKREVQSHLPGQTPPAPPPIPPAPSPAEMRRKVEEGLGLARIVAESGVGVAKGVAGSSFGIARDLAGTAVQGLGAIRPDASPPGAPAPPSPAAPSATAPAAPTAPTATAPSVPSSAAPAPAPSAPSVASPGPVIGSNPPVVDHGTGSAGATTGASTGASGPAPEVGALAIPDYDELSASQVVERLEGLDRASLDAIRSYETAHRGRNTILGKIAQLT